MHAKVHGIRLFRVDGVVLHNDACSQVILRSISRFGAACSKPQPRHAAPIPAFEAVVNVIPANETVAKAQKGAGHPQSSFPRRRESTQVFGHAESDRGGAA